MREPVLYTTYVNKVDRKKIAMPILSIYNRMEYLFSCGHGLSSKVCSWEDFNTEFEPSFVDLTEDLMNVFDVKDGTDRAKQLLKIYFEREERANAPTLYPHSR